MYQRFTRMLLMLLAFATLGSAVLAIEPVPVTRSSEPDPATVKAALTEFRNLSKKEKKERIKEAKKIIKQYKKDKKAGAETSMVLLIILAVLLPPLAVYLHEGEINNRFWISILLTLLFWIPGVIYALIVILGDGNMRVVSNE